MPREHIDFRSLLERVLPLDSLTSAERAPIQHALRTGVAEEIEQAAMLALAQLERHGAMVRLPSASNSDDGLVRYQTRDRLEVITLHLPQPRVRDGVRMIARASLPAQAQAALVHVRRLLRLDEPLFSSDPRTGDPRAALLAHLDEVGRDLLGAREVRFVRVAGPAFTPPAGPLDEAWTAEAVAHPAVLIYCPDTAASATLRGISVRAGIRCFALAAVTDPEGRAVGVLEVRSGEPDPFGPEALALIALIADCCASALQRATSIERLVFVDPLTGAYNRA